LAAILSCIDRGVGQKCQDDWRRDLNDDVTSLLLGRKIMNRLGYVVLSAVTTLALASASDSAVAQQNTLKEQLVGAWRLVSAVVEKDGRKIEPLGSNPRGAVLFVPSGYFSWNMLHGERPKFASSSYQTGTAEENKAAVQGTISFVGTYTITPDGSLTLHIIGSTFPNWEGTTRTGKVEISGDELKFTTQARYIVPGGTALNIFARAK